MVRPLTGRSSSPLRYLAAALVHTGLVVCWLAWSVAHEEVVSVPVVLVVLSLLTGVWYVALGHILRWRRAMEETSESLSARLPEINSRVRTLHAQVAQGYKDLARVQVEAHSAEQQLAHAQRVSTLGVLAAGLAHDVNTQLAVIVAGAHLARRDPAPEHFETILEAGRRASALTGRILEFGRESEAQPRSLDMNQLISSTLAWLRPVLGEDVDVVFDRCGGVSCVEVDVLEAEHALVNLAVNARDAMPRGGKLTIETRNVDLEDDHPLCRVGLRPGSYVRVQVRDTGPGVPAEARRRVFEPFYTTKDDRGAGLGLARVDSFAKGAGGHVRLLSDHDDGAAFEIHLPWVAYQVDGETSPGMRVGTETVLLVEHDESARDASAQLLEGHGYQVLTATGAPQALELCEARAGDIHLLMTDVVLTDISGRELAEAVRQKHPHIRVLYTSGFAADAVEQRTLLGAETPVLRKPVDPGALGEALRRSFDP